MHLYLKENRKKGRICVKEATQKNLPEVKFYKMTKLRTESCKLALNSVLVNPGEVIRGKFGFPANIIKNFLIQRLVSSLSGSISSPERAARNARNFLNVECALRLLPSMCLLKWTFQSLFMLDFPLRCRSTSLQQYISLTPCFLQLSLSAGVWLETCMFG